MRRSKKTGGLSRALVGALLGLTLSALEWALTLWMGVSFEVDGLDVSRPLMLFFALTYAVMGWSLGRLLDAKYQLQRDAETIREQHAKVLHFEKLASVGRLAAGVAHELRNSLGVVGSASALLLESLESNNEVQHKAGRFIQEEIHRLDGFVRSLLEFSKPIYPELSPLELRPIFKHLDERLGSVTSLSMNIELPEENLRCRADGDLLTQALLALLLNAQEAVGVSGTVGLSARAMGDTVCIDIADDGPGVSEVSSARIFEPFFTSKTEGTGLGLCMAQRIAEAHQGSLVLLNSGGLGPMGRGACFRMTLRTGR